MVEVNGVVFKIGGYVQGVLEDLKEFPKHDWDNVILVTGREGDGKTSFVKLCSYYLDPNVSADRWAYNAEQFEKIIDSENLPEGANVIWDESDELAQHWSNSIIQTMTRKMKRIRKKRLTIWLITPTFFDMKKYFAIFRARCLFDVYAEPSRNKETGAFEPNRGRVRFFSWERKRELFMKGVKEWNMHAVQQNWYDAFGKVPEAYPIKAEELELKKDEAMKALLQQSRSSLSPVDIKAEMYITLMSEHEVKPMWTWSKQHWANVLDIDRKTLYNKIKQRGQNMPISGDVLGFEAEKEGISTYNSPKDNPPIMKGGELQ
jgi:hypothetical protein